MEKMKLSREEYDIVNEKYQEQNGNDNMFDEQKVVFDEKLDRDAGVDDRSEEELGENKIGSKVLRRCR